MLDNFYKIFKTKLKILPNELDLTNKSHFDIIELLANEILSNYDLESIKLLEKQVVKTNNSSVGLNLALKLARSLI